MSFANRSLLCGALGLVLASVAACDDDPAPASDSNTGRADLGGTEAAAAAEPGGALAWEAALARAIRPPEGDEATYEVDPFIAALVVETLRTPGGEVFVWTPAADPASAGYRIETVASGSVWARLGLQSGDVVEEINGVALSGPDRVEPALDGAEHRVTLTLFREDLSFTASYRLEGGLAWRDVLSGIGPAAEPAVGDDALDDALDDPGDAPGAAVADDGGPAATPTKPATPSRPRTSTKRPSTPRPSTRPRAPTTPKPAGGSSSDIRCASANACTMAKRTFDQLVASPKKLESQADIVPAIRNDVHSGYKLKRVSGGSAISKLGFRAGDKITHVNGRYLGDDAQAMALYFSLGSTRVFKIRYERGAAKRSKTVTIR